MCVPIQWVTRDGQGTLTHIGGASQQGTPWGLSVAEATDLMTQRLWDFFVEVAGQRVGVMVVDRGGSKYLSTVPDANVANNLDSLPTNPHPLTGVLPEFPLSLPSVLTMSLMRIRSVKYAAGGQLKPLVSTELAPTGTATTVTPASSFWTQQPRWFYFDVLVPFPSDVGVFEITNLTKVPGDSPAARRALEDAGKGWWTLDYILTRPDGTFDPTKPSRLTEARIIARPSASAWTRGRVVLSINCFSLNLNCYSGASPGITSRSGNGITIIATKPAPQPQPQPAPNVTVPNVVGQRLDLALSTLFQAKFKVTVIGPVDLNTNLRVRAQSVAAGTSVKEGSGILLSTEVITAAPGVKNLAIANQSNRAAPLDIWLFDHTVGGWSKKTTIAYQATGQVSFADGHVFSVAAVDNTMPLCDTGHPEEAPCVYATPNRTFEGDDSGLTLPWTVT